jgi:uncharacterized protein
MRYAVLGKLSQPQGRAECEIWAPAPVGAGGEFQGPVTGCVVLTNTGAVISARGRVCATVVLECSRCLARHEVALDVEINEECRLAQIEQALPPGEEEPIPLLDADAVDLTELVRQVLALNIPPRSVCRPDCRGLCPRCGRNRNTDPCSCDDLAPSSPWAGLRDLLEES